MGGAATGAFNFIKQAGKEITGDAERERKRAARDAQRAVEAEQAAALKEIDDQKAKEAQEEKEANNLAAAKKLGMRDKSQGRRGTVLASRNSISEIGMSAKTLLGR